MEKTYSLTLPSVFEEVERIPDFCDDISDECEIDEGPAETFKLILSEAVTNAIVHGNREEPGKQVHVDVEVTSGYMSATVKDEGEGFDPYKKKDPLQAENLLDTGGRGIFLIEQFADKMEFRENGTVLYFRVDFNS